MRFSPKYVVFIWMVTAFSLKAFSIDPPVITCVSLDDDENLTLTWIPPVDSNGTFENYIVYYKDGSGGAFNQLQVLNTLGQTSAEFVGNFAGSGSFYMVSTADGGATKSLPSDTVSPIIINLFTQSKSIKVEWNSIDLPSPDSIYRVFRRIDSSAWELVGDSDYETRSFSEVIERCEAVVQYQVEIKGRGGCISRSNVASIKVVDKNAPDQTNLICASVDTATGFVNLEWEPTASLDGLGYLLTYFDVSLGVDTVFGRDSLTYQYSELGIDALSKSETLSVAPFDSCFDTIVMWYNQAADSLRFATLFVDSIEYDRCEGKIGLKWNLGTEGFPVGFETVDSFRIYRRDDKGLSQYRGAVSGSDSVFLDSGLIKGTVYEYVVAAFSINYGKEALSNVFTIKVKNAKVPEVLYVSSIVNDHATDYNIVYVHADTNSESVKFVLERALYAEDEYIQVDFTTKVGRDSFRLVDESGSASQTDYFYRIVAYDYCDAPIYYSEPAKSIWIDGYKLESDFVNEIEWTEYLGYELAQSSVDRYNLIRITNETQLDTIASNSFPVNISDTIFELTHIGGRVCYYVEAIESPNNIYGLNQASRSNLHCVEYEPRIFVPNAFTPDQDGINDIFLPDVNFIEVNGYKLSIYDRAGHLVHITLDPKEGWSGANEASGVYAYFLQMTNSRGEAVNYTGKVVLLR